MSFLKALGSGFAGAVALTAIHETARRVSPDAPRMDVLGMRAIAKSLRAAGEEPPGEDTLFGVTLAGDIASNSLYYALVGLGDPKNAVARGALLGLAAGLGAVLLPGPLGLGTDASARTRTTQLMTVACYAAGGLAAGAAMRSLSGGDARRAEFGGREGYGRGRDGAIVSGDARARSAGRRGKESAAGD